MTSGLRTTFEALNQSDNLAAAELLVEMVLQCPAPLADEALNAVLARNDHHAQLLLVRQFHRLSTDHQRRLLFEGARLTDAIRNGMVDEDFDTYKNALRLIREMEDTDHAPILIQSLDQTSTRQRDAIELLTWLGQRLVERMRQPADELEAANLERSRQRFLDAALTGIRRYRGHRAEVVPRTIMLLAEPNHPEMIAMLRDLEHPCHRAAISILRRDREPRVLRWAFDILTWRHPPGAVLGIIGERQDLDFVGQLLDLGPALGAGAVQAALKKISQLRWLGGDWSLLDRLSKDRQVAAVQLAMSSGISLEHKLEVLAHILDLGEQPARRAAAQALAEIPGAEANKIVLACLEDDDPELQIIASKMLRTRGIPNALPILLKQLDSPDPAVLKASQEALQDFRIDRLIPMFEQLSDADRRVLGAAVRKIDPQWRASLRRELNDRQRQRRIRAARCIRLLGAVDEVADALIERLLDEDYMVRRELIECLTQTAAPEVCQALLRAAQLPNTRGFNGAADALLHLRKFAREPAVLAAAETAAEQLSLSISPSTSKSALP